MFNFTIWFWNLRHRKLLNETKRIIFLKIFLEREVGIKHNFTTRELKEMLKILKNLKNNA